MSNGNELQNNDFILPGNLGTAKIGNKIRDIKSVFKKKDGSVTITVGETKPEPLFPGSSIGIYYPEKQIELPTDQANKKDPVYTYRVLYPLTLITMKDKLLFIFTPSFYLS